MTRVLDKNFLAARFRYQKPVEKERESHTNRETLSDTDRDTVRVKEGQTAVDRDRETKIEQKTGTDRHI